MSIHHNSLRSIVRRGSALGAAVALLAATFAPTVTFADSLNPLTHRSLTLSSSSPGWSYTDGSGNSTYAPPNSGANGKKTGNTFSFNVSTDSTASPGPVKTISFQYCTTSAGSCTAPGDDAVHGTDTSTTSDLKVVTSSPEEVDSSDFSTVMADTTAATNPNGNVSAIPGYADGAAAAVDGNFVVYYNNAGTWTQSTGWTMDAINDETGSGDPTGQDNYIVLANHTGLGIPSDTPVKIVFFGTTDNYIQNPGSGAFFVKINTYSVEYGDSGVDETDLAPATDANIIDGGVTVANVMNQSIQITTKVLETMQFSVGTFDPNVLSSADGSDGVESSFEEAMGLPSVSPGNTHKHGTCDPILGAELPSKPANVLALGNQDAESSLEVAHTYSTHSYWRLSSNSSAGATVYYSGHTLSNTVGDEITPIGSSAAAPIRGSEQFGLAIDNAASGNYLVDYTQGEGTYENADDNGLTAVHATVATDNTGNASYHSPRLYPLIAQPDYDGGSGVVEGSSTATFAFDPTSDTIPVPIATESSQVVDCVTAKMRYMANIAATTPAGIYTTKINYIAAPQY